MTQGAVYCSRALGLLVLIANCGGVASAGAPEDLLRGEAPLLFSGAEGEDGAVATLLADGVNEIRGDDIYLWVPAITGGSVDLGTVGQFFKIWDSGPEAGPDGNDDDRNGMRGMDFDPSSGTFFIRYEDTSTVGFAIGTIKDGDLMRLTPTSVDTTGFITGFTWTRVFSECANGAPDCIGTGDLNAISMRSLMILTARCTTDPALRRRSTRTCLVRCQSV